MLNVGRRIKEYREKAGMSQDELAKLAGYKSRSSITKIESGGNELPQGKIIKITKALGITPADLMKEYDVEQSNISAVFTDNIRMIPLYESVSAGFGAHAEDTVVDYLPIRIESEYEYKETICIRVSGDSMYPKIEDGDIIQVHLQKSVDSGDIAVVMIDGEEGVVKKVVYGKTWVELHSINPEYKTRRFDGAEVQRLDVVGKVKGSYKPFA